MARKPKPSATDIEGLYDSGAYRLTQERSDFLLPQIIDFVRQKKWINLRPEYQRRLVWDRKRKSLFIESLLMNIPVPPVFLYEVDLSRYEVMDGQQRLNAIDEFYSNELRLTGLETWRVLNGHTYQQCPPRIKSGLDRRRISASVLLAESASTKEQIDFIRRTVFERLNTGGQDLNAQELRNSLYSGGFNDLIIELAGSRLFDEIWEIPSYQDHYRKSDGYISPELAKNALFKRMTDCEIVLRFFAFRRPKAIKGSSRAILDNCMQEYREADAATLDELRKAFVRSLQTCHRIFEDEAFQVKGNDGKWKRSQALFDAVMVAVDSLLDAQASLIANRHKIKEAVQKALEDEATYEIVVGKPNTASAIRSRSAIIAKILRELS